MGDSRTLPPFPTDDFTLTQLEHALNTSIEVLEDGSHQPVGGEFTMSKFLDFMSGYDPERSTLLGYTAGVCGEGDPAGAIPIYASWDQHYTEHCVMRALIARIRELEAS